MSSKSQKRVTLRMIAETTGVHVTTVSGVLRGQRRFSQKTCERVERAAKKMGYRRDPALDALMAYRRSGGQSVPVQALIYLTRWPRGSKGGQYISQVDLFNGAQARAQEHGYRLDTINLGEHGKSLSPSRAAKVILNRGLQGIVVAEGPEITHYPEFPWEHFSAVALGYTFSEPPLHRVANHHFDTVQMAVAQALERGFRRLGLVVDERGDQRVNYQWSGGFLARHRALGARASVPIHCPSAITQAGFLKWFYAKKPDCIVAEKTQPITRWLKEEGVEIPRDVALVCLNLHGLKGRFSGVYQNLEEVGARAVDLLVGKIHRNERGLPDSVDSTLVAGSWYEGRSLPGR